MDNVLNEGLIGAVSGTAGIFIFLVVLGILVALINKAGGSAAFGAWAEKNIKSRTGAMLATFVLGVLISITLGMILYISLIEILNEIIHEKNNKYNYIGIIVGLVAVILLFLV